MGSPLTVALAEIRVSYLEEEALRTCPESPIHYYHFVDDGFGHFRNKIQADKFLEHLNSLSPDLDYTIEYPHPDGSIPFLDVSHQYTGNPPTPTCIPTTPHHLPWLQKNQ